MSNEEWSPPSSPLWASFAEAATITTLNWDVLKMAMESGWGRGDPTRLQEKLMDDLLANFSDKWKASKSIESDDVDLFFVGSMDDLFDCEVEHSAASPLSKVLIRLYDECLQGNDTGVNTIISRVREAEEAKRAAQAAQMEARAQEEEEEDNNDESMDDDGWATVSRKKKGGRRNH